MNLADEERCDLCGFSLLNQHRTGGWMPFETQDGTIVVCTRHVKVLVLEAVRQERAALGTSERERRAG